MTRSRTRYFTAICLLALTAFFLRAASLDAQSLWRDEVDALRFATAAWSEMLGNFTRPGWNGPLYYLLLRGWIALTGTTEYAMRFLSLVFGVLSVSLVYALSRRLFSARVSVIAACLTVTSPYLVWYSQEVKMYALVMTLALLAIYSLRRALEGGSWQWWLVQIVATTLAFYSHILAAFLIPIQVFLYFAWWPEAKRRWRGALVSLVCLTLPYLPLVVWQAPLALKARDTGFTRYTLTQMILILLKGWSTGTTDWGGGWSAALMGLLALTGLLNKGLSLLLPPDPDDEAEWGTSGEDHLALLLWLSIPLLSVWLISLRQPLFTDRYLIWTSPAFYILVAIGLTSLLTPDDSRQWVVASLLTAILVLNSVNLYRQATTPIKADFRAAASYLANYSVRREAANNLESHQDRSFKCYLPIAAREATRDEALIIFQIPYGRYSFDYYFPLEEYSHADGLYTNRRGPDDEYRMSEQDVARQMRKMTANYDVVWLVATEVSMWDERDLVRGWLDEHAGQVITANFTRVDVHRYKLSDR